MTNFDVNTVGELYRSVGPTGELQHKFGQPLSGSHLARAAVAVAAALVLFLLFQILMPVRRTLIVKYSGPGLSTGQEQNRISREERNGHQIPQCERQAGVDHD
jgi:hypothetical protein